MIPKRTCEDSHYDLFFLMVAMQLLACSIKLTVRFKLSFLVLPCPLCEYHSGQLLL